MVENRESFFRRLDPFMAPSVMNSVQLAYTLAKFGHRSQVRKELDDHGDPIRYFEHVRRVAIILVDEVRIVKPEMIVVALLHDIIEDAPNLPPAMIEHCFGTDVVNIVKVLSKVPKEGYLDRFNMSTDWRAYACKASDRLDNLRSLSGAPLEFQARQVTETRGKYYDLFDRMVVLTPDEFRPRIAWLRDEVRMTTERHAARMEAL